MTQGSVATSSDDPDHACRYRTLAAKSTRFLVASIDHIRIIDHTAFAHIGRVSARDSRLSAAATWFRCKWVVVAFLTVADLIGSTSIVDEYTHYASLNDVTAQRCRRCCLDRNLYFDRWRHLTRAASASCRKARGHVSLVNRFIYIYIYICVYTHVGLLSFSD